MKKLVVALLFLTACSGMPYRPISYPWLCEKDPKATQCYLLGYEIDSDDPVTVKKYAEFVCKDRVLLTLVSREEHRAFVRCKSR